MPGMTNTDIEVLRHYARTGNRELYWNHLAQMPGNDGYGALALGVVRNDNVPGATANVFAQQVARTRNGVEMTERQWERFGVQLMQADFALRRELFENNDSRGALNLPAGLVQKAHDDTFEDHGIDVNAWTPRELLEAARNRGGEPAAGRVWQTMLDNRSMGWERFKGTLGEMLDLREASNDMGNYFKRVTQARIAAGQVLPHTDPDRIGVHGYHHEYDRGSKRWMVVQTLDDPVGRPERHAMPERDPARIAQLDDARAVRRERLAMRDDFHPLDRHRTLLRSPQTLADGDIDPAQPALARGDDPRDPQHPRHALYRGIEQGVHAVDARCGRAPDAASACVTAALYEAAVRRGLTAADHVVPSIANEHVRAGENMFVVQGGLHDARDRVAHVATDVAVATPVEQSLSRAAGAAAVRDAGAQVLAQARTQEGHAAHAPRPAVLTP